VITHNIELAAAVSDRVLGMVNGSITEDLEDISSEGISSWLAASEKRTEGLGDR
jgi:ABC-type glutathione transport system ATPase component